MGKRGPKPRYENAEEMQRKIDAFFLDCAGKLLIDETGKPILRDGLYPVYIGRHPPTLSGLALALGFATRKSIRDYKKKPRFERVLTVAHSRIEMYAEERLYDRDGVQGAKFNLVYNFGWIAEDVQGKNETGRIVRIIDRSAGAT